MSIAPCFSSSYAEARAKFRAAARGAAPVSGDIDRSVDVLRRALAGLAQS